MDWVGKDGSKRKLEVRSIYSEYIITRNSIVIQLIMGRQKLKKSFQYEVKWRGLDHKYNTWVARDDLLSKGFTKVVQQFDDLESSRDGAGSRDTSAHLVRKHLEQIGLDGDIAQYNEISGLSGGKLSHINLVLSFNGAIDRPEDQACSRRVFME
jgi:elongation factor 3